MLDNKIHSGWNIIIDLENVFQTPKICIKYFIRFNYADLSHSEIIKLIFFSENLSSFLLKLRALL